MDEVKIIKYQLGSGKVPFDDWVARLDNPVRHVVRARLARIRAGNCGDSKRLANAAGVYELRLHMGPGYRIYYAKEGNTVVDPPLWRR